MIMSPQHAQQLLCLPLLWVSADIAAALGCFQGWHSSFHPLRCLCQLLGQMSA
jgi:hypothetical protein